jgi:hypothetical protein
MIALRRPSHRTALAAGLGLLALVNALALGGVAWNRGAQDSRLQLTQRELQLPYSYLPADGEDPGLSLRLEWHSDVTCRDVYSCNGYTEADWLDASKLASLGFDVTEPARDERTWEQRSQEREAILVLEFEGPAYVRYLQGLQSELRKAQEKAAHAGEPGDPVAEAARAARGAIEAVTASIDASKNEVRSAAEALNKGAREDSRLFAVDAGLDREALRRKYPDRSRYALVRGLIGYTPAWDDKRQFLARGRVNRLLNEGIHLPRPLAQQLGIESYAAYNQDSTRFSYEGEVAFGRALEPWVLAVRRTGVPR